MFLAAVQSAQKQSKEQLQSSAAVTEVPSEVVGPPPPPACLAPLLKQVAQQGLRTLGMHPLFLRHAFLELSAVNKQVDDISVLKDFVNLMYVDVSNNTIKTLKPLEGIPALVQLRARGNMLTECLDFRPALCSEEESWSTGHQAVGSMLTLADLRDNQISCLHELADHYFLECLLLANNQISVIKGISKLRYLQTLDLSHNRLAIIEGLDHLPIRELNLSHNNILSLDGLSTMPCLSALNVSNNNIVTLAPLRANDTLTYVDASDNEIGQIRQVEFLAELPWVQWLSMQGNPCFKKPHYRLRIIYRMANLQMLDQVTVSYEEKIRAQNLYKSPDGDLALRESTFQMLCPNVDFVDYSPQQLPEDEEMDLSIEELAFDPSLAFRKPHVDPVATQVATDFFLDVLDQSMANVACQ